MDSEALACPIGLPVSFHGSSRLLHHYSAVVQPKVRNCDAAICVPTPEAVCGLLWFYVNLGDFFSSKSVKYDVEY